jgi:hypothetical protein
MAFDRVEELIITKILNNKKKLITITMCFQWQYKCKLQFSIF